MTTHELAKLLLASPDVPVVTYDSHGMGYEEVRDITTPDFRRFTTVTGEDRNQKTICIV